MAASGLQELLELIYASNTVVHILTGKAIARAVRAHLIIDAALNALMLTSTYNVPLLERSDDSGSEDVDTNEVIEPATSSHENLDLDEAAVLYEKLMQNTMSADQVCRADVLTRNR